MKILLFGKNGQVGSKLFATLAESHQQTSVETIALGRDECDVTKEGQIQAAVNQHNPDLLINATAYTAVDKAESDSELAYQANAKAILTMANVAKQKNIWLIHYSTDYVFDGNQTSPYREIDPTCPTGVYGASKLQGEQHIINTHNKYVILRTSWVYGEHGNNFPKTILKLAQERTTLKIVDDQVGTPTYAGLISNATYKIAQYLMTQADQSLSGIYHLTSQKACSWYTFAKFLIQYARDRGLSLQCDESNILPVTSKDYPTAAQRPAYAVLDTSKVVHTFGIKTYHWREDATIFVQNYINGNIS